MERLRHATDRPAAHHEPTPIAVDLGSGYTHIWIAGHGCHAAPTVDPGLSRPTPLVRRGAIVDRAGCVSLLTRLCRTLVSPLPVRPVVVVCRPVHSDTTDQEAIRQVITAAVNPGRILLIDTVRAAAIGSGTATGVLLVVDVGAQLTETAVLVDGRTVAARRAEFGTGDVAIGRPLALLVRAATGLIDDLRRDPGLRRLTTAALARGPVLVGDGAATPELARAVAASLGRPVRAAGSPRQTALRGAALVASAACQQGSLAA